MKTPESINFTELTKHMLLQTFAPASVVTDTRGNILYVHGDTGKYLRPAPGKPSLNVVDMAREGLQIALRTALQTAITDGVEVLHCEAPLMVYQDSDRVRFSVRLLPGPENQQTLLLISFEEGVRAGSTNEGKADGACAAPHNRVKDLERHLTYSKLSLQATIESQQAANEEAKSINEELQAANEELETSREELQSINEELVTVNTERQIKIEQLTEMQNDMKNLLDNINVGTVFLDENLLIRRYSNEATRLYHISPSDIGRPLAHIKSRLAGGDLILQAQHVLDTLKSHESQVHTAEEHIFLARIQPYRTLVNTVSGVVLTFTDITEHVRLEKALQADRRLAEAVVDTIREPMLVLTPDLVVVSANQAFYQFFQVQTAETLGRRVYELGDKQWDIPVLRELLEKILPNRQTLEEFQTNLDFPAIGHRNLNLNARCVVDRADNAQLILLVMTPDTSIPGGTSNE